MTHFRSKMAATAFMLSQPSAKYSFSSVSRPLAMNDGRQGCFTDSPALLIKTLFPFISMWRSGGGGMLNANSDLLLVSLQPCCISSAYSSDSQSEEEGDKSRGYLCCGNYS